MAQPHSRDCRDAREIILADAIFFAVKGIVNSLSYCIFFYSDTVYSCRFCALQSKNVFLPLGCLGKGRVGIK